MRVNNFANNCHKKTLLVSKHRFSYLRNPMPYIKLIYNNC